MIQSPSVNLSLKLEESRFDISASYSCEITRVGSSKAKLQALSLVVATVACNQPDQMMYLSQRVRDFLLDNRVIVNLNIFAQCGNYHFLLNIWYGRAETFNWILKGHIISPA